MADRSTTITLKVNDQFSGPQKQFADGMEKMVASTGRASQAIDEHEAKQATLHEVLGGSRREVALLERTFIGLTGTTGALATGLEALATGLGPVGLLITGIGVAGSIAKEKMDEYAAAVEKARVEEVRMSEARSSTAAATKKMFEDAFSSAQAERDKVSATLQNLKEQADLIASRMAEGMSTNEGAAQFQTLTEKIIATQTHLDELTNAMHIFGGGVQLTNTDLDSATHHLETTDQLVLSIARDLRDGRSAFDTFMTGYNAFNTAHDASMEASGVEASTLGATVKVQVKSWSDFYAEGSKFASQMSADNAKAAAEAETMSKVYSQINDASKFASAGVVANMNAIAHSALTASEKMSLLRQYISTLPAHMRTQIEIAIQTHADALLMKILGAGKGGGTGHQQGDEWNFNLEGEDFAVRAAYMNMYHDYGTANAAWERDHRAELEGQGVTGPGQPNTQTGETYQYATGVHETVSSPRTMTVGERGPERVDVTPGGSGGMGGNIITINWSSLMAPSAYETQQLARRLKQAMANDGA